jgi:hypothetical protein
MYRHSFDLYLRHDWHCKNVGDITGRITQILLSEYDISSPMVN